MVSNRTPILSVAIFNTFFLALLLKIELEKVVTLMFDLMPLLGFIFRNQIKSDLFFSIKVVPPLIMDKCSILQSIDRMMSTLAIPKYLFEKFW